MSIHSKIYMESAKRCPDFDFIFYINPVATSLTSFLCIISVLYCSSLLLRALFTAAHSLLWGVRG